MNVRVKQEVLMDNDKGPFHQDGQTELLGIIPPRMPLGYIVETYPAHPAAHTAVTSPPVLENNTFIPGESLPTSVGVKLSALGVQSPIDLSSGGAASMQSRPGSTPAQPTEMRPRENVTLQCEEIQDSDGGEAAEFGDAARYDEDIGLLSDASSFDSEDGSIVGGYHEQTMEDHGALQDETLLPYTEVCTQRSVAFVISGYAYTKNRQQQGKTYLRCRERGCSARAMVVNNVQRATVFNNTHNHPPPDLSKKVKKRRLSPPPYYDVAEGERKGEPMSSSQMPEDQYMWQPSMVQVREQYPQGPLVKSMVESPVGGPRIVYVHSLQSSKMATTAKTRLPEFLEKMEAELTRVVDFWLQHSHDTVNGGFFVCLGRDGKRYDDLKYCWMQGRQVWMYCKLYNTIPKYRTPEILQAAKKGGEFLMNYVKNPTTGKCYFAVTKGGKAVKIQRSIFSECFYMLAMSELARATQDSKYKEEAIKMLNLLQHWVCVDDTGLGRPQLLGAPRVNSLARGMIFLNLLDELTSGDPELQEKYASLEKWSIEQSLQHIQRDGNAILETVSADGKELSGSGGRLMNPGHAIETGWFLLQCGMKHDLAELKKLAMDNFITKPFQTGWDAEQGGLFSFLDVDGLPPTQLEWNMKLWWPCCEALIASLMAYGETKEDRFLGMFEKVFDYTFARFVDPEHGEWFGYLNREGKVTHDFKGGPYKGCFHVPRCLLMCTQMLQKILKGE